MVSTGIIVAMAMAACVFCIIVAVGIYFYTQTGDSPAPTPSSTSPSSTSPSPTPAVMPVEGQALKCSPDPLNDPGRVYRYTGGQIRYYPNVQVANSWDANWNNNLQTFNCTGIPIGANMAMKV